jgi:RNA-directed DNA polymerase
LNIISVACNRKLFELQAKLYNALKLQLNIVEIHKIHNEILTTFATRALALRKVTSNKGGKTAGIDNQVWLKDEQK